MEMGRTLRKRKVFIMTGSVGALYISSIGMDSLKKRTKPGNAARGYAKSVDNHVPAKDII